MRIFLIAAVLALATPAFAEDAPPVKEDKDKVVCRRERPTGSSIPKRICMTKADWEMVSDESRDSMDRQSPPLRRNEARAAKPKL